MNLSVAFEIEEARVEVPWGITSAELIDLLPTKPRHVTSGYYTLECKSLGGLEHVLGFHFRPRPDGHLGELEFFRPSYLDLKASFEEFQRHLEGTFGPPDRQQPGDEGLPHYTWVVGSAQITHHVLYRFGPEEHVRITCGG